MSNNNSDFIVQRCVCYRIKKADAWSDEGYKEALPIASHGYCDKCLDDFKKKLMVDD
jgi:hypothetical protein